ncbi:MAG: N-acetylmuramoyl-L-alanine amidase [Urechidicola sp.]|nr:N-acetylmuramoyl-L-alanine amidase [Urechidicola sp.]
MKKVAIIIGHRSGNKGAKSEWLGTNEYDYMKAVALHLKDVADVYERPNTPFVTEAYRIKQLTNKVNKKSYDLVLSLHFNAFKDDNAHGSTALHYVTNKRTKRLGQRFTQLINLWFGVAQRDLIPITSKYQRGGALIMNINAPALLLEPFFGSNPADCVNFYDAEEKYAELIKELICEYLYL